MITDKDIYLDEEVEKVEPFERPAIRFSHIESDDTGLRPYQAEMKHNVYGLWDKIDNVMLQMPTGTGKTIVFTSVVKDILRWCNLHSRESKILIVAHRRELIRQASKKLGDISHGVIVSGEKLDLDKPIQVASIQTFMSRRHYEIMRRVQFDFIIIDEAHHCMAPGYQKLWEMFPNSKKLGVTATPWRMSHCGFTALFGDIVLAKSIEWFVNHGYLANYDYISIKPNSEVQHAINGIDRIGADGDYLDSELSAVIDKDKIRAGLYKSYEKYAKGKKGIIYAIDRKHANHICELYATKGVSVCMIDGTTPTAEREQKIADFANGSIEVIVNVNIFSEGFDCPDIEFIQLARPTKSLSLYLQQVGRGLRISEGKETTVILDNVGLYNRFGTPMANRHWRYHFLGTDNEEGYNDGSGIKRDLILDSDSEYEPDYSEADEEMVVVDAVVLGKLAADGLVLGALGLFDFPGGLFHRGVFLHPVKGETCGVVVLVEEVLPEVGEEIPEAVHADELPLVLFAGLERLQLTVCRDALDAFRLLFLLVVSHQVTLFLRGVFAALSSGIYFLHDC